MCVCVWGGGGGGSREGRVLTLRFSTNAGLSTRTGMGWVKGWQ